MNFCQKIALRENIRSLVVADISSAKLVTNFPKFTHHVRKKENKLLVTHIWTQITFLTKNLPISTTDLNRNFLAQGIFVWPRFGRITSISLSLSIPLCFERENNSIRTRLSEYLPWKTRVGQVLLALVEEKSITIQQPVDWLLLMVRMLKIREHPWYLCVDNTSTLRISRMLQVNIFLSCLSFTWTLKLFSFPPPKHKTKISCLFLLTCLRLFEANYSQIILKLVDDLVMSTWIFARLHSQSFNSQVELCLLLFGCAVSR